MFWVILGTFCNISWRCSVMVVATAQLHSTKSEIKFFACSKLVCGVLEICDGEDLWHDPGWKEGWMLFVGQLYHKSKSSSSSSSSSSTWNDWTSLLLQLIPYHMLETKVITWLIITPTWSNQLIIFVAFIDL